MSLPSSSSLSTTITTIFTIATIGRPPSVVVPKSHEVVQLSTSTPPTTNTPPTRTSTPWYPSHQPSPPCRSRHHLLYRPPSPPSSPSLLSVARHPLLLSGATKPSSIIIATIPLPAITNLSLPSP
ncbi:hypothetical protein Dimus_018949 [Dionaea muscipula]